MGWIKRNLFFTIGGVIALGLLGAAGFYFYVSWEHNAADFEKLNEIYNSLKAATSQNPSPGNDKVNNIQLANEQTAQIRQWIQQARKKFAPIPSIPAPVNGLINGKEFADALPRTIAQLQREADAASVALPPGYNFSFSAQSGVVMFPPGSLGPLAQELGEVKTISEVLFSAGINALESIQRVSVSEMTAGGQPAGPQSDYINAYPVTNSLAVITPYQVTFRSFTPEIAKVIEAFAASPHGFIIRTVAVQPATATGFGEGGYGAPGYGYGQPGYGVAGYGGRGYGGEMPGYPPPGYGQPGVGMPGQPGVFIPGRGGLQTILDEQLLRISMEVDVVKLLPTN